MLEMPIYLLVMSAMVLVAIYGYVYAQRHLYVMDALSVMAGPRATMMEFRAVTGAWPRSNAEAGFSDAMLKVGDRDLYRLNSVQIREGGAVDFGFARGDLSIRAWEGRSPGLPLEWICGQALPLPGTTAATDRTTLSNDDLPSPCRAHK
jgi:hypothetical protein